MEKEKITINYYSDVDFPNIDSIIEKNGKKYKVIDNSILYQSTAEEIKE